MDPKLRAALVKRFKLADDATDEQIAAAVAGDTPEGETTEPGKDGTDAGPAKDTTDAGAHTAVTPNPEAGQAQAASEGTVTVPKATWERLTGQVSDLAARERARETDGLLTAALAQGRLTPPEIASWRESLEDDARRPGALALLATLPQRVAVVELGEANATPADFDEKAWDAQAEAAGL